MGRDNKGLPDYRQQALPDQRGSMDHQAMPLLAGRELGHAIRTALKAAGLTQRAVADRFGVKPQSVHDWISTGAITKDKLLALFDMLRPFVGPDHWGLAEFPAELALVRAASEPGPPTYNRATSLREAFGILHRHVLRAPAETREELRDVFAVYTKNPSRYASTIDSMIELLSGEPTSSKLTSDGAAF